MKYLVHVRVPLRHRMNTGDGTGPGANSTRWPKLAPNEANLYDLVYEEAARLVPDEDTVVVGGGCMIGGDMYDIELVLPFVKLKSFCDTMVAHGVHPVANVIPATDDQEVMSA